MYYNNTYIYNIDDKQELTVYIVNTVHYTVVSK